MKKTFTIECTMNEEWIDTFLSMLKHMEYCGNIGHSEPIIFYCDGDGGFRPKFKSNTKYKKIVPELKMFNRALIRAFDI